MRPNHASESAAATMDWLLAHARDQSLARAALTTIVRHHNAGARGQCGSFRAHPAAQKALAEVLTDIGIECAGLNSIRWDLPQAAELSRRLIRPQRAAELLSYLLLARVLRLADQRSQELARQQTRKE